MKLVGYVCTTPNRSYQHVEFKNGPWPWNESGMYAQPPTAVIIMYNLKTGHDHETSLVCQHSPRQRLSLRKVPEISFIHKKANQGSFLAVAENASVISHNYVYIITCIIILTKITCVVMSIVCNNHRWLEVNWITSYQENATFSFTFLL